MQPCARHVGHVVGTVAEPVSHDDFLPRAFLLEFMFEAKPVIIFIPFVTRVEVIGLAVDDDVGLAGPCGGGEGDQQCHRGKGYGESFLHEPIVEMGGESARPRRSGGRV